MHRRIFFPGILPHHLHRNEHIESSVATHGRATRGTPQGRLLTVAPEQSLLARQTSLLAGSEAQDVLPCRCCTSFLHHVSRDTDLSPARAAVWFITPAAVTSPRLVAEGFLECLVRGGFRHSQSDA